MANLGLLSFLSGAGAGAQARRKEIEDKRRAQFLEKIQEARLGLDTKKTDADISQGNRGLDIQDKNADTSRLDVTNRATQFGKQFDAEYGDVVPGGFRLDVGGRSYAIPGSRADLKTVMPFLTQKEQDSSAMARQTADNQFRFNNPGLFGSNQFEARLTPEQAAVYNILKGVYANPGYLGETPGARKDIATQGVNALHDFMPGLFNGQGGNGLNPNPQGPGSPGFSLFNQFTKENPATFSSQRQGARGLRLFQQQHPDVWAQMGNAERSMVLEYIKALPEISDQDMAEYQSWLRRGGSFTTH